MITSCLLKKKNVNSPFNKLLFVIVSTDGLKIDETKLAPLFEMKHPKNIKDVQSFLGVCNWFRDFVPNFAEISMPLTELTKKGNKWSWNESHQNAIMLLLHYISSSPCIKYFNDKLETFIYTDA